MSAAVTITIDGVTVWQAGPWPTTVQAQAWMDRNDEFLGDLVTDLVDEHLGGAPYTMHDVPEADCTITHINDPRDLEWSAE